MAGPQTKLQDLQKRILFTLFMLGVYRLATQVPTPGVDAAGLARVDFFYLEATQEVFINEINTLPGFTANSMYPQLWEATGVSFPQLVDQLIQLAIAT